MLKETLVLLRKGNEGEVKCLQCLQEMPDKYYIACDISLKNHLENYGMDIWLKPVVVLCNPNINIEAVYSPKMPVIKLDQLNNHILRHKRVLPDGQAANAIQAITNLIDTNVTQLERRDTN